MEVKGGGRREGVGREEDVGKVGREEGVCGGVVAEGGGDIEGALEAELVVGLVDRERPGCEGPLGSDQGHRVGDRGDVGVEEGVDVGSVGGERDFEGGKRGGERRRGRVDQNGDGGGRG